LSNKTVALGTAVILVSIITLVAIVTETYVTLQGINPVATIAAVTVAIIGIAWFKKTSG
jgi:hypothetical protein